MSIKADKVMISTGWLGSWEAELPTRGRNVWPMWVTIREIDNER